MVFDTLVGYLDQKGTYSRELDANGQPTEKIKNKETYHYLDAERYIIGKIRGHSIPLATQQSQPSKWGQVFGNDDEPKTGSKWRA